MFPPRRRKWADRRSCAMAWTVCREAIANVNSPDEVAHVRIPTDAGDDDAGEKDMRHYRNGPRQERDLFLHGQWMGDVGSFVCPGLNSSDDFISLYFGGVGCGYYGPQHIYLTSPSSSPSLQLHSLTHTRHHRSITCYAILTLLLLSLKYRPRVATFFTR